MSGKKSDDGSSPGPGRRFGRVLRLNRTGGYGFLLDRSGEEATERFFHAQDFDVPVEFDHLKTWDKLSFVPAMAQRGPKAIELRFEQHHDEDAAGTEDE